MEWNLDRVSVLRERILYLNAMKKARPRCPQCDRALALKWDFCRRCGAAIDWIDPA